MYQGSHPQISLPAMLDWFRVLINQAKLSTQAGSLSKAIPTYDGYLHNVRMQASRADTATNSKRFILGLRGKKENKRQLLRQQGRC